MGKGGKMITSVKPTMFGKWRAGNTTETGDKIWYFFWNIYYHCIGKFLKKFFFKDWWK